MSHSWPGRRWRAAE